MGFAEGGEGIQRASVIRVAGPEPEANTLQGNYGEVAGVRNRLVQEQDTMGRFGTTVGARRAEVID